MSDQDFLAPLRQPELGLVLDPRTVLGSARARARRRRAQQAVFVATAVTGIAVLAATWPTWSTTSAAGPAAPTSAGADLRVELPTGPETGFTPPTQRVPAHAITNIGDGHVAYVSQTGALCILIHKNDNCRQPSEAGPSGSETEAGVVYSGTVREDATRVDVTLPTALTRPATLYTVEGLDHFRVWTLTATFQDLERAPEDSADPRARARQAVKEITALRVNAY